MVNTMRSSRLLTLLIVLLIAFSGCGDDSIRINLQGEWRQLGMDSLRTLKIQVHGNEIYLGTEKGIYRKPVDGGEWELLGLEQSRISSFVVFSSRELLVPISINEGDSIDIAKTTDGGKTWFSFQNGFGGDYDFTPGVLTRKPNTDYLFARAIYNVARSPDRGNTWESVRGPWDAIGTALFLTIDPNYPNTILTGGANAIFQPNLIHSDDNGDTWQLIDITVDGEGLLTDLVLHPANNQAWIVGVSKDVGTKISIKKTRDEGKIWKTTREGERILNLVKSPQDGRVVYASGANDQQGPWFIASRDFGDTWQEVINPDEISIPITADITAIQRGESDILFFATNRGVFSYTIENLIP